MKGRVNLGIGEKVIDEVEGDKDSVNVSDDIEWFLNNKLRTNTV